MPKEFVKAAFRGPASEGKTNIPLSKTGGGIAQRFQNRGNQPLGLPQPDAVVSFKTAKLTRQTVALRNATGQQAGSRDRAGWRCGVEVGTANALFRQTIHIRRLDGFASVATEVFPAEVIDEKYDNVFR